MSPTPRKEFRIVWLPLAIACVAAFVCGANWVNDPKSVSGIVAYGEVVLRHAAEWCPGILCISFGILAALVFGAEYQHRTLSLLLAQPIPRSRIWNQKSAMLGACAVVIVMAWLVGSRMSLRYHWSVSIYPEGETTSIDDILLSFAAFFLATLCSATFWSLVARSVIGGVVLNAGFQALTGLCIALIAERVFKLNNAWRVIICASPIYAAAFLILGRRKFMRLQVTTPFGADYGRTESSAALKMEIPVLRATRRSALANLIRKEVRLNKPLFVMAGFFVAVWFLTLLVCNAAHVETKTTSSILAGTIAVYVCIIFGLGGSVSLGEEKSMGVHSGQLVLPVQRWKLWGTKLGVAFVVCTLLGLVLPVALAITCAESPLGDLSERTLDILKWGPLYVCTPFIILGFWAATHFQNSVLAVLATVLFFPVLVFSGIIGNEISRLANGFENPLLAYFTLKYHLSPFYFQRVSSDRLFPYFAGVLCLLLLIQSIKAFVAVQPAAARVLRHAIVLFVLSTFALAWIADFQTSASGNYWFVFETKRALERSVPETSAARALDDVHGADLPLAQLIETGRLSKSSLEWLRGSKIRVSRTSLLHSRPARPQKAYSVSVVFPHEPDHAWVHFVPELPPSAK